MQIPKFTPYKRRYNDLSRYIEVAGLKIRLPVKPQKIHIDGAEKRIQRNCKFERQTRPKNWRHFSENDKARWIAREWNRREEGHWFMNYNIKLGKAIPTYITGTHYLFLNYWTDGVHHFDYRYIDREFFLWWDAILRDPNIHGGLYIKKRREGASTKAGCIAYDLASQYKNKVTGLQAVNEDQSEHLFNEMIVKPFVKLQETAPFFKPKHTGQVVPKGEINFAIPSEKISRKKLETRAQDINAWGSEEDWMADSTSLNTRMTYGPSGEKYYDGTKLLFYWGDEIGKVDSRVNVNERHRVVKHCVEMGTKLVGKMLYTSTVEEIKGKGADFCKQLWNDSDPAERNANGRTRSGLVRYFNPAYRGLPGCYDEYGNDEYELGGQTKAYTFLNNERDALRKAQDHKALASYMRKFPFSPDEAFLPSAEECIFDSILIDDRMAEINKLEAEGNAPYVQGDFAWKSGKQPHGESNEVIPHVIFTPNKNGRFWISRKDDLKEGKNAVKWVAGVTGDGKWVPLNRNLFIGGVDPYDYSIVVNKSTQSEGAGAIMSRFNPLDDERSNRFMCVYKARPRTNEEFYEDMIMLAVFYGCEMVIEQNKIRCIDYFHDRGFGGFVAGALKMGNHKKKKRVNTNEGKGGTYTTRPRLQAIADVTQSLIVHEVDKIDFPILLKEWRSFSIERSREFDLTIAAGYAQLGNIYAKTLTQDKKLPVYNLVQTY